MQLHRGKFIRVINEINKIKYEVQEYDTPKYIRGDPVNAVSLCEINGKKYKISIVNVVTRYYGSIETAETIYVSGEEPYTLRSIRFVIYNNKTFVELIVGCAYDTYGVTIDYQIAGDDLIK
jgi:hypothetical protein